MSERSPAEVSTPMCTPTSGIGAVSEHSWLSSSGDVFISRIGARREVACCTEEQVKQVDGDIRQGKGYSPAKELKSAFESTSSKIFPPVAENK